MLVHSVRAQNFRPFAELQELRLGDLTTIVGKNDVGKSNVLRVLQLFFEKLKIGDIDVHDGASPDADVVVEVTFSHLPEAVELEPGVSTTLSDELLVNSDGFLHIRKTFPRSNLSKPQVSLTVLDFSDDSYFGLAKLKEKDLNSRCSDADIDVKKSGRGITNKGKREQLRNKAEQLGITKSERPLELTSTDPLWRTIDGMLPEFEIFESDTRLGVDETTFQSQFRPITRMAADEPDVAGAREVFTGAVSRALQDEVNNIYKHLRRYTEDLIGLTVRPNFAWDKAVTFDILGKDQDGVEHSLDRRGSGMRRLLMVAFFQYLAERDRPVNGNYIYAVEEPENCLHPGLQRDLVESFRTLASTGTQILMTTHSPVFVGASSVDQLALVTRSGGVAKITQGDGLNLSEVADELGVEPADQITCYKACVFVEGPSDIQMLTWIGRTLHASGHLRADPVEEGVGFVTCGGENIKDWVNRRAMGRLSRRYAVIIDSDRSSPDHVIPGRKLNWKSKCEADGAHFWILRKRELENYIHADALDRAGFGSASYNAHTDMKSKFGPNVHRAAEKMSADEILAMDTYTDDGEERHELVDILSDVINLVV